MSIVKILQLEHANSIFTLINKCDGSAVTMRMTTQGHDTPIFSELTNDEVINIRDMFGFRLERIL